ncbi:hypothetical protein [Aquirufa sp. A-Brett2-15D]|jgi:hypothetical protein
MKNPLNKQIVSLMTLLIFFTAMICLESCSQEKKSDNSESAQMVAITAAWEDSGEWVQKLTLSPSKIIRNTIWGQDFNSITDSLDLAETQPDEGKSYTLYFDESDLNFSDITYVPNEQNKLQAIMYDIFVDSSEDVQPLIEKWKSYLDAKFGVSEVNGKKILWTKNKNTRIELENVSTPKDPGIKISFQSAD